MRIIKDSTDFRLEENTVVAIGKFDGVHKGHEKIIRRMRGFKEQGLKLAIFTFSSPPGFVTSKTHQKVITTTEEKRRIFETFGVDYLIEFPFFEKTAAIAPADFIEDILLYRMRARALVCGPDLRYGYKGRGDIRLLKSYEKEGEFTAHVVEKELWRGEEISSSRIREQILSGSIEEANSMLVMPFMFFGEVVHGRRLGRTIGMPTVNLLPDTEKLMPPSGVYYSKVRHLDTEYRSITNIGTKPTIVKKDGREEPVKGVETYIYNFNDEIYGDQLLVFILSFVRPEINFGSIEALKEGMRRDIEKGREWHREHF
ncbi:MAG TPA: bifunctional riboflavin kinase/FMN adenylyltransferase [Lachnospiraceae bacterium]|nr:bifunctional riboflavin kinase/FMN adenylyltransferase [Lachnospiraceae bacterium]